MPQIFIVIAALVLSAAAMFSVKNNTQQPINPGAVTPTSTASPSATVSVTPILRVSPKTTATPKMTPAVVWVTSTPTPTRPTPTMTRPTSTPTVSVDTQPPVIDSLTGPADGSTISFNSFCFPVHVTDNVPGGITVRYSFNSGPNDWNTNYAPCYQNLPNSFYVYVVQARDAAGNVSATVSRAFRVEVPVSPTSVPPTPTVSVPAE